MESVQKATSVVDQSVILIHGDLITMNVETNACQSLTLVTGSAPRVIPPVATDAERILKGPGTRSVMAPVYGTETSVMESVQRTQRSVAITSVSLYRLRKGIGSVGGGASTDTLSAMEPVLRVTLLVGITDASAIMIQTNTSPVMASAWGGLAPTLPIYTESAGTDVSTGEYKLMLSTD